MAATKRQKKKTTTSNNKKKNNNNKKQANKQNNNSKDTTTINGSSNDASNSTANNNKNDQSISPSKSSSSSSFSSFWDYVPFVIITVVILIPYALKNMYLYVFLQRPDIINSMVSSIIPSMVSVQVLRPAVKVTDQRQVLIVGTISSGTKQVSYDLKNNLGGLLEIGHENSNSESSFVRDGTISWFHGIRFIPRPTSTSASASASASASNTDNIDTTVIITKFCQNLYPSMGFHPYMFREKSKGNCSIRNKWDECWKNECIDLLQHEWGCGLLHINSNNNNNNNINSSSLSSSSSTSTCLTPFSNTLHQVRHPLRTIESLVTKFCINGIEGNIQPSFLIFINTLFPQYEDLSSSTMSCIEAAGYYIYEYNTAMIDAKKRGYIDDMYHVEDVSPCDVASMAGFMGGNDKNDYIDDNDNGVVYKPNREKIIKICKNDGNDDDDDDANKLMISKQNLYNKGQVTLDWDDLLGGKNGSKRKNGDRDLQKKIKKLTKTLNYPT
jgi:hypothetical protein